MAGFYLLVYSIALKTHTFTTWLWTWYVNVTI